MKYIICVGDGMADRPVDSLGGKTPLEYVDTPGLDEVVRRGLSGKVRTVPRGMAPGSDVANMSLLGYDPARYYTGRAPIEAAGMGIELGEGDIALRCNLVHIEDSIMRDYSAGHIGDDDAREVLELLAAHLDSDRVTFHFGTSYRHLIVLHGCNDDLKCTPPHDISGRAVDSYLPSGKGSDILHELSRNAHELLRNAAINKKRRDRGETPVSDIWLWGNGRALQLPSLSQRYGLNGSAITAVNLVKGLGVLSGLAAPYIEGATGYLHTNYAGKLSEAEKVLQDHNFVYLHVEAPDETSHEGSVEKKCSAIKEFDTNVVSPVLDMVSSSDELRMCVLPDHATPLETMTHDSVSVPFGICGPGITVDGSIRYSENDVSITSEYTGETLFDSFIRGNFTLP